MVYWCLLITVCVMEELKKVVDIIMQASVAPKYFLEAYKVSAKEQYFIKQVELGRYADDAAAATDLYQSHPNDVRYKMLKMRVKKKLYNVLNTVDPQKISPNPVRQKEIECNSLIYQANVLRIRYEFDLVSSLAGRALQIAEEFDFSDMKVSALELLSLSFSEQSKPIKFAEAQQELQETMRRFLKEREAVSLFQHANIQFRKSTKTRKDLLPELPKLIAQLEELWHEAGTFSAYNAYYRAYIMYHELEGNFSQIINLTVDALEQVASQKVNAHRFDLTYNNYIMVYAHFRAKQFTNGLRYARANLSLYPEGSRNWFAYMENYFLLAIHARQYELGDILQTQVFERKAFATIPTSARERWLLYRSYFRLVYPATTIVDKEAHNPYLLYLPEYSKDKLGFNVAILTLQFIYLLERGDKEALQYRIEGIKKYVSTHLKEVFSLRSKLFMKLLVLTVTLNFNASACRKKGATVYKKLLDTPAPGDAYAEIEIVPYEHLWELILAILSKAAVQVEPQQA